MAEYIEREKAIERIKPHVKPTTVYGEWYIKATEHALDILELIPAADVQPLDVVCKEIAELIGNPCRIVRAASVMMPNCDDCSVEVNSTECWKRYFKRKFAKEG